MRRTLKLQLENINVNIHKKPILKNVSLTVEEGEFISLLGPSGCGKSTMLKTIAGLLDLEDGNIFLGEVCVNDLPPEKRGTVIVFQDLRLFPNMTALGNVEFGLKLKGFDKKTARERAVKMLESVHLAGMEDRKIHQMSGGQLQRVALARAIAAEPHILLLDEPFSSLDEALRIEMRSLVRELHDQYHCTTILVTHDKKEALSLSDKVALMINGELVQYDTPEKVYQQPKDKRVTDYFGECIYTEGIIKNKRLFMEKIDSETFASEDYIFDREDGAYLVVIRPSMVEVKPDINGGWKAARKEFLGEKYAAELKNEHGICIPVEISGEMVHAVQFRVSISGEKLILL